MHNLKYADDLVLEAENEKGLQNLLNFVIHENRKK